MKPLFSVLFLLSFALAFGIDSSQDLFLNETVHHGYLPGAGTDQLYYWFFESRDCPEHDPLILWLSGGPGCANEVTIFTDNGPFYIHPDTLTLYINPYSINAKANVLYIDQPIGTGYSFGDGYKKNETQISESIYAFLLNFMEKFPQYKGRDFYAAGKSYAGHYVPPLATYILKQNNPDFKLTGIALGNAWVNPFIQLPSCAVYAYQEKLINKTEEEELQNLFEGCLDDIRKGDIPIGVETCSGNDGEIVGVPEYNHYDIRIKGGNNLTLGHNFSYVDRFLAQPEIQKILGVEGKSWTECNANVSASLVYDIAIDYTFDIESLLDQKISVFAYNGNKDYTGTYIGAIEWTNNVNYKDQKKFNKAKFRPFGSYGTYKSVGGLTYMTVYNAGHLVSHDQPAAGLAIMNAFIGGRFSKAV